MTTNSLLCCNGIAVPAWNRTSPWPPLFAIAARFFDDPTHALCFAASIGGDTDTIAAIAGAMLGAWHGMQGFDKTMLDQVLSQLAEDNHLDLVGTVTSLRALRDDSALNDVNIV